MSLGDNDNMDTISKETSEREKQVLAAGFMYLLAFSIEKTERSDTKNFQSSIFNSGLSGLGLFHPIDFYNHQSDIVLGSLPAGE